MDSWSDILLRSETLGKSNTSQVIDLTSAIGSEFTPAYGIYENGVVSKVALFNYVDDLEGTREPSDLKVSLIIPAGIVGVGGNVKVKYLEAKSVSSKNNITWAGQVCLFLFVRLIKSDVIRLLATNSKSMAASKECWMWSISPVHRLPQM